MNTNQWKLMPVIGCLLMILLGLIALFWPGWIVSAVPVLIGLALLVMGIVQLLYSVATRDYAVFPSFQLIQGLINTVIGIIILCNRTGTTAFIAVWFGIWALVSGVSMILMAVRRNRLSLPWITRLTVGIIEAVFGIVMIANPFAVLSAFVVCAGIYLVVFGVFLAVSLWKL